MKEALRHTLGGKMQGGRRQKIQKENEQKDLYRDFKKKQQPHEMTNKLKEHNLISNQENTN